MYFVYILTNKFNTVLYTGVTSDLQRRLYEHREQLVDGFTKKYNVSKLVYFEMLEDVKEAIKREKTIKNLLRRKKLLLIQTKNPELIDLYEEILS